MKKLKLKLPTPQNSSNPEHRIEKVAYEAVQSWLRRKSDHPLIENMKDESSLLIRRLCRNPKFRQAVLDKDRRSIDKIVNRSCYNAQRLAYRATTAKKLKDLVSHEGLLDKGFDASLNAYNDDQELTGMPSDPHEMIEWIKDDELVRSTSRFCPELTEELLKLDELTRQIIVLSLSTKYTAEVIAELLGVSVGVVTTRTHRYRSIIKRGVRGPLI